jgi:hypothetical protein
MFDLSDVFNPMTKVNVNISEQQVHQMAIWMNTGLALNPNWLI